MEIPLFLKTLSFSAPNTLLAAEMRFSMSAESFADWDVMEPRYPKEFTIGMKVELPQSIGAVISRLKTGSFCIWHSWVRFGMKRMTLFDGLFDDPL